MQAHTRTRWFGQHSTAEHVAAKLLGKRCIFACCVQVEGNRVHVRLPELNGMRLDLPTYAPTLHAELHAEVWYMHAWGAIVVVNGRSAMQFWHKCIG